MDKEKQICKEWASLKYKWLLDVNALSIKTYLMNDLHNNPSDFSKSETKLIKQPMELF